MEELSQLARRAFDFRIGDVKWGLEWWRVVYLVHTFALLVSIIIEHDCRTRVKEVLVIVVVAEVDGECCEGEEGIWRVEPDELYGAERVSKVAFSTGNSIC